MVMISWNGGTLRTWQPGFFDIRVAARPRPILTSDLTFEEPEMWPMWPMATTRRPDTKMARIGITWSLWSLVVSVPDFHLGTGLAGFPGGAHPGWPASREVRLQGPSVTIPKLGAILSLTWWIDPCFWDIHIFYNICIYIYYIYIPT